MRRFLKIFILVSVIFGIIFIACENITITGTTDGCGDITPSTIDDGWDRSLEVQMVDNVWQGLYTVSISGVVIIVSRNGTYNYDRVWVVAQTGNYLPGSEVFIRQGETIRVSICDLINLNGGADAPNVQAGRVSVMLFAQTGAAHAASDVLYEVFF